MFMLTRMAGVSMPGPKEPELVVLPYTYSSVHSGALTGADGAGGGMRDNSVTSNATVWGSGGGVDQWIRMGFGQNLIVDRVVLRPMWDGATGGWSYDYTNLLDIQISSDGSSWTTVVNTGAAFTADSQVAQFEIRKNAWFIRLLKAGSGYCACGDFQVFAK